VNKCTNYMVTYMGTFTFSSERERERERGEEGTFNLGNNQKIALEESLIWILWGEGILWYSKATQKRKKKKKERFKAFIRVVRLGHFF